MFNTLARAVLRYNRRTETYRLLVAFNITERTEKGAWKFPVQKRCDFVSGDISYRTLDRDLQRVLNSARETLRTNHIEVVD